jgi:hypothetical protein
MSPDVSEEYFASILREEKKVKQETSVILKERSEGGGDRFFRNVA